MGQCASRPPAVPSTQPPSDLASPGLSLPKATSVKERSIELLLLGSLKSLTSSRAPSYKVASSKNARQQALDTDTSGIHTILPLINPDRAPPAGQQSLLIIVQEDQPHAGHALDHTGIHGKLRLAVAWASRDCLRATKAASVEEYSQFLQKLLAADASVAPRLQQLCKTSLEDPQLSSTMLETVMAFGPSDASLKCADRGVHLLAVRPCLWAAGYLRKPALLVQHLPTRLESVNKAEDAVRVEIADPLQESASHHVQFSTVAASDEAKPETPDAHAAPSLVHKLSLRLARLLSVLESSHIMMTVCTPGGKVVYQNSRSVDYAGTWQSNDEDDFLEELFKLNPGLYENAEQLWYQGDAWGQVIKVPGTLANVPNRHVTRPTCKFLELLPPMSHQTAKGKMQAGGAQPTKPRLKRFASMPALLPGALNHDPTSALSSRLNALWDQEDAPDALHDTADGCARALEPEDASPDFAMRTTFCADDLADSSPGEHVLSARISAGVQGGSRSCTLPSFHGPASIAAPVRSRVISLLETVATSPTAVSPSSFSHDERVFELSGDEEQPQGNASNPGKLKTSLSVGAVIISSTPASESVSGPTSSSTKGTAATQADQWHDVYIVPFLDPESSQQMLLVAQSDVTERSKLEQSFMHLLEMQLYMLENIFPRHILERMARLGAVHGSSKPVTMPTLMKELSQAATHHDCVTIMFTDIVGFTSMAKEVQPEQVMSFLNELFSKFDSLVEKHGVYKVETVGGGGKEHMWRRWQLGYNTWQYCSLTPAQTPSLHPAPSIKLPTVVLSWMQAGDCYIVCAGLLDQDADGFRTLASDGNKPSSQTFAARRVLNFAADMLTAAKTVMMPNDGQPVRQRVGVHTGPVVSGLIGQLQPKFNLFGDTMNTASRMESTSKPGRIQVSEATYQLLKDRANRWECKGGVEVKGKGVMNTYLLEEARSSSCMLYNTLDVSALDISSGCPTSMNSGSMYPVSKDASDSAGSRALCRNVLDSLMSQVAGKATSSKARASLDLPCRESIPQPGFGSPDSSIRKAIQQRLLSSKSTDPDRLFNDTSILSSMPEMTERLFNLRPSLDHGTKQKHVGGQGC